MAIFSDLFNTPLHYAALGGHAESFNCVLQHDGDLTIENSKNDTPLDSARKAGHPLLIEKAGKSYHKVRNKHQNGL